MEMPNSKIVEQQIVERGTIVPTLVWVEVLSRFNSVEELGQRTIFLEASCAEDGTWRPR